MFVAVNVNNLEIDFAILEDSGKITTRFDISALDRKTSDQYVSEIKNVFEYLKVDTANIDYVAILSVVPKFTHILEEFFNTYIKVKPLVIENSNINISLMNSDIDKKSIPVDILTTTYAGTKLYNDNVIEISCSDKTLYKISNKGMQPNWHKNNMWFKMDTNRYEGLAETIVSDMLDHSNVDRHFSYRPVTIQYKNEHHTGCMSPNGLNEDEELITIYQLMELSLHTEDTGIHGD